MLVPHIACARRAGCSLCSWLRGRPPAPSPLAPPHLTAAPLTTSRVAGPHYTKPLSKKRLRGFIGHTTSCPPAVPAPQLVAPALWPGCAPLVQGAPDPVPHQRQRLFRPAARTGRHVPGVSGQTHACGGLNRPPVAVACARGATRPVRSRRATAPLSACRLPRAAHAEARACPSTSAPPSPPTQPRFPATAIAPPVFDAASPAVSLPQAPGPPQRAVFAFFNISHSPIPCGARPFRTQHSIALPCCTPLAAGTCRTAPTPAHTTAPFACQPAAEHFFPSPRFPSFCPAGGRPPCLQARLSQPHHLSTQLYLRSAAGHPFSHSFPTCSISSCL